MDTNIISEIIKPTPDPKVITWIDQQNIMLLLISTITVGRPMSLEDRQSAAIACAHNCSVPTRKVIDFENAGINLINPFL